jgi:hypothetical protein
MPKPTKTIPDGKRQGRDPKTGASVHSPTKPAKTTAASPLSQRAIKEISSAHSDALKRLADR